MAFQDSTSAAGAVARRGIALLVALLPFALAAPPALGVETTLRPVVVELFTSQGCSSCPPADRLLNTLARRPNVFALTLPVDIWDYVGWKDTLAVPYHAQRQRQYAKTRGDGRVYTPQAVVNGVAHVVGSDLDGLQKTAEECYGREGAMGVPVTAVSSAAGLRIEVGAAPENGPSRAGLWLVRVASTREVVIKRGENSGQSIAYSNVARSFTRIGEWRGQAGAFHIPADDVARDDSDGWMVLLQAEKNQRPGVILGAVKSPGL